MAEVTDLTYAQIRQRIAGELNRDDLDTVPLTSASVIHQFFLDRVLHYSKNFFYAAQFTDLSKSTAVGDPYVDLPDGWQQVNYLQLLQGGSSWMEVGDRGKPVYIETILAADSVSPSVRSLPSMYALHPNPTGGKMAIRFYGVPDQIYPLRITMDKPPAAPSADAETSFWTCDAQTLMIASTCEAICRRRINRPLKAAEHKTVVDDEELSLNSKSIRISGGIHVRPWF